MEIIIHGPSTGRVASLGFSSDSVNEPCFFFSHLPILRLSASIHHCVFECRVVMQARPYYLPNLLEGLDTEKGSGVCRERPCRLDSGCGSSLSLPRPLSTSSLGDAGGAGRCRAGRSGASSAKHEPPCPA